MVAVLAKLLRAVWIGHWGGILAPRWVDIVHKKENKRNSFFFLCGAAAGQTHNSSFIVVR